MANVEGMKTRDGKELTWQLCPKWPSEHYGIATLTIGIGLYLLVLLARAAFASPPVASKLQSPLMAAARLKVAELRHKFEGRVAVAEAHGMYLRAPECAIKNITSTKITHAPGSNIMGLVTVACIWKSPDQRTFGSREEAEDAELTEEETGKLRLIFVWSGGKWMYRGAKKE